MNEQPITENTALNKDTLDNVMTITSVYAVGYVEMFSGTCIAITKKMPSKFHQWMMNKLLGWKFSEASPQSTKVLLNG